MKKQAYREKHLDNRVTNRDKHSENGKGFTYGDEITELKNKLQVESTKTGNVSVIEMCKDVLLGKYKVFEDIIPSDLEIYAMKSMELEKYEYYRDIRNYVKEYHNNLEVNSQEFVALVNEHEERFQSLRMDYIEREAKSRLEMTTKQELIKRLVKEKHDYENNKIIVGNMILKLLSKQLRGDLQVPEGMTNKYDSNNNLIEKDISNDPIRLIDSINSIIRGRFSGNTETVSPEQKERWNDKYARLDQGKSNTNEYIREFDKVITQGRGYYSEVAFNEIYSEKVLISKLLNTLKDHTLIESYRSDATRAGKRVDEVLPETLIECKRIIIDNELNNKGSGKYINKGAVFRSVVQSRDTDRYDDKSPKNSDTRYGNGNKKNNRKSAEKCFNCNEEGHRCIDCKYPCAICNGQHCVLDCKKGTKPYKCGYCERFGHTTDRCRKKIEDEKDSESDTSVNSTKSVRPALKKKVSFDGSDSDRDSGKTKSKVNYKAAEALKKALSKRGEQKDVKGESNCTIAVSYYDMLKTLDQDDSSEANFSEDESTEVSEAVVYTCIAMIGEEYEGDQAPSNDSEGNDEINLSENDSAVEEKNKTDSDNGELIMHDETSNLHEANVDVKKDESYQDLIEATKHKYYDLWEQICNRQPELYDEEQDDIEGEIKMLSELEGKDVEYSYKAVSSNHSTKVDKMECVLLDSGANVHVFGNRSLLNNVRQANRWLSVKGISERPMRTNYIGYYEVLDLDVYWMPEMMGNVVCWAKLSDKYGGIYPYIDEEGETSYEVNVNERMIQFKRINSLYLYCGKGTICAEVAMIESSRIRTKGMLTRRTRNKMKYIAEWMDRLGTSVSELKRMVENSSIDNLDIELEDLVLFKEVFGNNKNVIAAKLGQRQNLRIDLPIREDRTVALYGDLFFLTQKIVFLVVVTSEKVLMVTHLADKETNTVMKAIIELVNNLKRHKVEVSTLYFDGEASLPDTIPVDEVNITVEKNYRSHIGQIEVYNRLINERVNIIQESLKELFMVPARLLVELVYYCVIMLNLMPREVNGVVVVPRTLLTGVKVRASQLRLQFGDYAIVKQKKNKRECIALRPVLDSSDSWIFYDLQNNRTIQANSYEKVKLTDRIIEKIIAIDNVLENNDYVDNDETVNGDNTAAHEQVSVNNETNAGNAPMDPTQPADATEVLDLNKLIVDNENADIEGDVLMTLIKNEKIDTNNMSYKKALTTFDRKSVDDSTLKEVSGMIEKNVFEPVERGEIDDFSRIIYSFIFYKSKHDSYGNFVKLKARLVANGSKLQDSIYETMREVSGETPSWYYTITWLQLMASKGMYIQVIDVPSAYLNAVSTKNHYMMLDENVTRTVLELKPNWEVYRDAKGRMIVRLMKSIYGLRESGHNWATELKNTLKSYGLVENIFEPCLYHLPDESLSVIFYVDDVIIAGKTEEISEKFIEFLNKKYGPVSRGGVNEFTYLGVNIKIENKAVYINGNSHVLDIIQDSEEWYTRRFVTPAVNSIIERDADNEVLIEDKQLIKMFHVLTARLLYIALKVRHDILFAVIILSGKVSNPTENDCKSLSRIIGYLRTYNEMTLELKYDGEGVVRVYSDASHAIHANRKSHTGIFITIGTGPILIKSVKQKVVSKSSTEAELYAISFASGLAINMTRFIISLGVPIQRIIIYEDNTSVIEMIANARPTSDLTRHISIHHFYISELVNDDIMNVEYVSTEGMLADYFTKPLSGERYRELSRKLGHRIQDMDENFISDDGG